MTVSGRPVNSATLTTTTSARSPVAGSHYAHRVFYKQMSATAAGGVVMDNLFRNHKNSNQQNGGFSVLTPVVPACRAGAMDQDGRQQSTDADVFMLISVSV